MGKLVISSLTLLLVTALCAVTIVTGNNLMTSCLNDVTDCPDGVIAQYPLCGNCSVFILCAGGAAPGVFTCPTQLVYDINLGVCDYASLANTTSCETTTTTTTTTTGIPNCITSCIGQKFGLYPSCNGCEYFFSCFLIGIMGGEAMCLEGQKWDNKLKKCDLGSSTCSGP